MAEPFAPPGIRVYPGPAQPEMLSPEEDEAVWGAAERAIRFAGQQEYQRLVNGGALPEEALRRTAHKIFFNDPQHITSALRATRQEGMGQTPDSVRLVRMLNPETGEVMGYGYPTSSGSIAPFSQTAQNAMERGELSATRRVLDQENRQRIAEMESIRKALMTRGAVRAADKPGLTNRLATLQAEIAQGRSNFLAAGRSPGPIRPTVTIAQTPETEKQSGSPFQEGEIVRNKKNGKRYKIVNGEPVPL